MLRVIIQDVPHGDVDRAVTLASLTVRSIGGIPRLANLRVLRQDADGREMEYTLPLISNEGVWELVRRASRTPARRRRHVA